MHKFLWLSWIKAVFLDLLLFIKFYFILHICLLRTYIFYSEDHLSGAVVRLNNSQLRNSYLDLPPEQVTPWYAALRLFNQTLDLHSIRNKLRSGECVMQEKTDVEIVHSQSPGVGVDLFGPVLQSASCCWHLRFGPWVVFEIFILSQVNSAMIQICEKSFSVAWQVWCSSCHVVFQVTSMTLSLTCQLSHYHEVGHNHHLPTIS